MKDKILNELRDLLRQQADEKVRKTSLRFFKDGDQTRFYGLKNPDARKIGKLFLKELKSWSKHQVFELCEELWKSGYMEEKIIACMYSESRIKELEPEDFETFEHWVREYVDNENYAPAH